MTKNPYNVDTPEWQLWENMTASEKLYLQYSIDAGRYTKMAAEAREKAAKYRAALDKLNPP